MTFFFPLHIKLTKYLVIASLMEKKGGKFISKNIKDIVFVIKRVKSLASSNCLTFKWRM